MYTKAAYSPFVCIYYEDVHNVQDNKKYKT